MSWLQRIASTTFQLEGSEKISQPKTISNLATMLDTWASRNVPRNLTPFSPSIDMDGLEVDNLTGTINWYITEEHQEEVPMYIKQWIQEEMAPWGFETRIRGPEQSGMWADRVVYRIDILNNPTNEYSSIPEMNITSANATALFGILNIPNEDLMGSMDLRDMRQRLALAAEAVQQEFTKEPSVEGKGEFGVQTFDFGRALGQVQGHIQGLQQIVDYGIKHGFQKLRWI